MSTWGGIGEGLTAGMNARIALEEQRRREAQAQANADREFKFKGEQAERAQANADRTFEAGREDAARAQENADRTYAAGREDAANAQSNAERSFANADRAFAEGVRRADIAQENADREFKFKRERAAADDLHADREFGIRREAQDWANKQNEEKLRTFRLANEKLDREERQARMIDDAKKESGRQQLAAAIYRVTGSGGQEQTITIKENGQDVQKKVRVLPQAAREQIFGKDGYFKDVQNVVAFEDEKGNTVAALVKPDGTMQMFSPEQQYDIYNGAFGKGFADEQMRSVGDKKDLGMFAAKENIKATAQEKARNANDPYGNKRKIDAAVAILKADDSSEGDRASALEYLGSVFGKTENPTPQPTIDPNVKALAKARGFVYNEKTKRWEKKGGGRITAPSAK